MMIVMLQQLGNRLLNRCYISNPGNEISEWFNCRSDDNSVKIGLPPNWLNDEFMGIAMCVVFTPDKKVWGVRGRMDKIGNSYRFHLPSYDFTESCLWLAYVSREQFEHDRSLTLEVANRHSYWAPWKYEYDSTDYVSVSTSTCFHAQFEVSRYPKDGALNSKIKNGIRLVYKRDIECSEDNILPATDASILYQHHNCSTLSVPDFVLHKRGNVHANKSRVIPHMFFKEQVRSFRPYGESEGEFLIRHKQRMTILGQRDFVNNFVFYR